MFDPTEENIRRERQAQLNNAALVFRATPRKRDHSIPTMRQRGKSRDDEFPYFLHGENSASLISWVFWVERTIQTLSASTR